MRKRKYKTTTKADEPNSITPGAKVMKTLNISDLREVRELTTFSMTRTLKKGEHYKDYMIFGRMMPTTKSQIETFRREGVCLDVLGLEDAEKISDIFAKHGIEAHFRLTKSKTFCRLLTCGLWDLMLKDIKD